MECGVYLVREWPREVSRVRLRGTEQWSYAEGMAGEELTGEDVSYMRRKGNMYFFR